MGGLAVLEYDHQISAVVWIQINQKGPYTGQNIWIILSIAAYEKTYHKSNQGLAGWSLDIYCVMGIRIRVAIVRTVNCYAVGVRVQERVRTSRKIFIISFKRKKKFNPSKPYLRYCEDCRTNALMVTVVYPAGRSLCASRQMKCSNENTS